MRGVRLKQDDFAEQFGISRRLAARMGALLAKNVETTAAVLEMAGPGSGIERLFLHRAMLQHADRLDTDRLAQLAEETDAAEDGPFTVVTQGESRIIALEEEILAQEAWEEEEATPAPEPGVPGTTSMVRMTPVAGPSIIGREEAASLFTAEQVVRLKLDALTSADSNVRASALRQLQYAPLTPEEKGSIYLKVLLDPVSPVRSEAIRGLEGVGFDLETADAVQTIFEGDDRARQLAIERMGLLFKGLPPVQQQVVLAILLETLREVTSPDLLARMMAMLAEVAEGIAAFPSFVADLGRACLEKAFVDPARLAAPVRAVLVQLGRRVPDLVADLLDRQLATLRDPELRVFVLTLTAQLEVDDERRAHLAGVMAGDLVAMKATVVSLQKLGHNLVALGRPAAAPLLERFRAGDPRQTALLMPFLDMLCLERGMDREYKNRVVSAMLKCLRVADRRTRLDLLRSRVGTDSEIAATLRRDLAEEVITDLNAHDHPHLLDRLIDVLELLEEPAVGPLFDLVRKDAAAPLADRAIRVIGRILSGAPAEMLERIGRIPAIVDFAEKCLHDRAITRGGYAQALGAICAADGHDPERSRQIAETLVQCIGRVPYPADLLEGIGILAASKHIPLRAKIKLVHMYSALLRREPNDKQDAMRVIETEDGKLYEFSRRAEFDTAVLPVVVQSLERIGLSESASPALRDQVMGDLLAVWQGVADWTVVWGPRATEALSRALGNFGSARITPTEWKVRIGHALHQHVGRLSVVRALGSLCAAEDDSDELNALTTDAAFASIAEWINPDVTQEERRVVLTNAASMAARRQLNSRSPRVRRLRREVAGLLFEALREGMYWSREPLVRLRDCPTITKALRNEIDERLSKAFALAKRQP